MSNSREHEVEEIIDLTSLDYSTSRNIPRINYYEADVFIDLVNESFEGEKNNLNTCKDKISISRNKSRKVQDNTEQANERNKVRKSNIGLCSICWDKLGKKPLASTKCGHVFCQSCLETSLKHDKRCPTCRRILKGAASYHPLYLELV